MELNMSLYDYDIVVIGSGPAGQKAAIQGAKAGKKVAIVESDRFLGGHCVYRGTIPSKTLRQNAVRISEVRNHQDLFNFKVCDGLAMESLITNMEFVTQSHNDFIKDQIVRNGIDHFHGKASFVNKNTISLKTPGYVAQDIYSKNFIIATGSFPREPDNIPIDHEHIFDSDSILSMVYLPQSLVVLGGGVIASEYASIFLALGVNVTMIDRYEKPLGFLDEELTDAFVESFNANGGRFIGKVNVVSVRFNGIDKVVTKLSNGEVIGSDKVLCAAGRVANVKNLGLENIGLELNDRGVISVNESCQTEVPNIYAAGDVIGPPSLASASMEQGRRAACGVLGQELDKMTQLIPMGIYAIPELSSVGLSEQEAEKRYGNVLTGHAFFNEIARGQIAGIQSGLLKIVSDAAGEKVLGVHIVGEGATELIHIGQMAILNNSTIDSFVENIFNFPTQGEAYRVAALKVVGQRQSIDKAG